MGASDNILKGIQEARDAMLKISPLQKELRHLVRQRLDKEGWNVGEAARYGGTSWTDLKRFLDGTGAVASDKKLAAFGKIAKRADLATEIGRYVQRFSATRFLVMSLFSKDVIRTAFDLIEQYVAKQPIRMEDYANVFGEYAPIVTGVLVYAYDGCKKLEDPKVQEAVTNVLLADDFEHRVTQALETHTRTIVAERERLDSLVEQLMPMYGNSKQLAKALKISEDIFYRPKDRGSMALLTRVRAVCEHELARLHAEGGAPRTQIDASAQVTARIATADPPVLTQQNFAFIDQVPTKDELAFTRQTLVLARVMLERLVQIRDDKKRLHILNDLSGSVEDLVLAAKLFSYEYPNGVLRLFDAEREGMQLSKQQTDGAPRRSTFRRK